MINNALLFLLEDVGGVFDVAEGVNKIAVQIGRSIFYEINKLIYRLIVDLYQLFEYLCNARLLDTPTLNAISEKVGMVLGIVMLFIVIFNFIQMLLDPDKTSDKEMGAGAIVKKCLLVIVMLGVSGFFFDALYSVQRYVIGEKILYKLILPDSNSVDEDILTENFGSVLSARTFGMFYTVNENLVEIGSEEAIDCVNFRNLLLNEIVQHNNFTAGNYCLLAYGNVTINGEKSTENFNAFIMDYNFLLQTVVGVILVYLLIMYAIKVGIRVVQLTVLQIISPMAIISYLSPKKDNMFSKWWNIYFSTYIDAFIRIAIIYFVVYLSALLLDSLGGTSTEFLDSIGNPTDTYTKNVFIITMILALLAFAKKAPDLIKELFPAGASKLGLGGLGMKDMFGLQKGLGTVAGIGTGAAIGLLGGTLGGVTGGFQRNGVLGAIRYGITGALGGVGGGALRGMRSGFGANNIRSAISTTHQNQHNVNTRNRENIVSGSTTLGRAGTTILNTFNIETPGAKDKREIEVLNNYKKNLDNMESYADAADNVRALKRNFEFIQQSGMKENETQDQYTQRLNEARSLWKDAQHDVITNVIQGNTAGIDDNVVRNIESTLTNVEREYSQNRRLFNDAGVVQIERGQNGSDYATLDRNVHNAESIAIHRQSTEAYQRHQANERRSQNNRN